MSERTKVFISYAREDYLAARRLYQELQHLGAEPWLDKECILPGQRWELAIEAAIRESNYVIVVLSSNSVAKRGYVQKELRIALDVLDTIPESEIFLIPVKLDDAIPPHPRLRELQWVEMYPSWDEGFARIRDVLDFARQARAGKLLTPSELSVANTGSDQALDLTNTVWAGIDSDGDHYTFEFLPGALLRYKSPTGTWENARWTQDGARIYWQSNNEYSQYRGDISGGRMTGTAQNVAGHEWEWDLQLKRPEFARQARAGKLLTPSELSVANTGSDQALDLTNTVWAGIDSDGDHYTFEFLPGALLRYKSPTGTWENARWTQDGAHIYWQSNNEYSQYRGDISGGRMTGTAQNVAGHKWEWDLQLKGPEFRARLDRE